MKHCGNAKCQTSTGICERTTHGAGLLDEHGYFQHPCFTCARHYEKTKNADWPHPRESAEPLKDQIETRTCRCGQPFDEFKNSGPSVCDGCYSREREKAMSDLTDTGRAGDT